jgi:hypothetical protein
MIAVASSELYRIKKYWRRLIQLLTNGVAGSNIAIAGVETAYAFSCQVGKR